MPDDTTVQAPTTPPTLSRVPRSLRELCLEPAPIGLLAYTLMMSEERLRTMCFIDNEYGDAQKNEVEAISGRVVAVANQALARYGRHLRIMNIVPFLKRHGHIVIEWMMLPAFDDDGVAMPFADCQPIVANMYERSKRPEDEDEERVGPRRGGKGKTKSRGKRKADDAAVAPLEESDLTHSDVTFE